MSAVNLKKMKEDISIGNSQIQVAALSAILQLSATSVENSSELEELKSTVLQLIEVSEGDVLFLGRKVANHLNSLTGVSNQIDQKKNSDLVVKSDGEDVWVRDLSSSDDRKVADSLSWLLRHSNEKNINKVIPMVKHSCARVRSNAIEFIERYGNDRQILEHSMFLLQDESNRVRGTVLSALGRIKPDTVEKHFEEMLNSKEISIRESAVYALSRIKGEWVVKLLILTMNDSFEGIRVRAAEALGRQKDIRALEALKSHLNDLSPHVAQTVENSIAFLTMEEVEGLRKGEVGSTDSFSIKSKDIEVLESVTAEEIKFIKDADECLISKLNTGGQKIYKEMQSGSLISEQLEILYCDIVKLHEFERQYNDDLLPEMDVRQLFKDFSSVLGNREDSRNEASLHIHKALKDGYITLALRAVRLFEENTLKLDGKSELVQVLKDIKV